MSMPSATKVLMSSTLRYDNASLYNLISPRCLKLCLRHAQLGLLVAMKHEESRNADIEDARRNASRYGSL